VRVPRKPQFRTRLADRWAQQVKRSLREALRLFDPCNVVTFKRLDRVGCVVLHALKVDPPTVRAVDPVNLAVEQLADAERLDLEFEQLLDRLR
jgi:hypothetical protein